MNRFKTLSLLISATLLLGAVGCGNEETVADAEWTGQTYKLAVNPFMEKDLLLKEWQPIADYLSEATGATFEIVIAEDFKAHLALVNNGEVDFAAQNPLVTSKMLDNTTVILKYLSKIDTGATTEKIGGTFISRRESEDKPAIVPTIWNIPGHTIAVISLQGHLSHKMRLKEEGIDTSEVEYLIKGSLEEVIRAVYDGEAEVGYIRVGSWGCIDDELEYPGLIADIGKGVWVPSSAIVAQNNLTDGLVEAVQEALLKLDKGSEVLAACSKVEMFVAADNSEYAPFKDFE
ncbi:phosphate/phosphite/phosphonate ABC transporter substrate-binding protein [bacterium]|nr:phosphate/phosphite/phosphonate ABC transporter substrate-binding protein [bacterium]